eukprot:3811944-Rhodomonas_salina.2
MRSASKQHNSPGRAGANDLRRRSLACEQGGWPVCYGRLTLDAEATFSQPKRKGETNPSRPHTQQWRENPRQPPPDIHDSMSSRSSSRRSSASGRSPSSRSGTATSASGPSKGPGRAGLSVKAEACRCAML